MLGNTRHTSEVVCSPWKQNWGSLVVFVPPPITSVYVDSHAPAPKPKPVVEVWPVKVPAGVLSFDTALNVVLKHPDTGALLQSGPVGKTGVLDPAQAISLGRTKI